MVLRNTGLWLVVWVHQDGLKNGAVIGESTGLPAGAMSGSPATGARGPYVLLVTSNVWKRREMAWYGSGGLSVAGSGLLITIFFTPAGNVNAR